MDSQELIYGPIADETSDKTLQETIEALRWLRQIQLSRTQLWEAHDVQNVTDTDTRLPAYTPVLVNDDAEANFIAEAKPYLREHYAEFFPTDGDLLNAKRLATRLTERLRADGLTLVSRFGTEKIERIPVRGDFGAMENLVSYRDFSGTRHEVGESQVNECLENLYRKRRHDIDARIDEVIRLMASRHLRKELGLPLGVSVLPQKKSLRRICWASEKLDQMVAWANELHRLGLVEEEPNEILFHCQCNSNVYDTEKRVLHSAFDNPVAEDRQLHWKGQLSELLLMLKFLNERKNPSKQDPVERVVKMMDSEFYVHFFFVSSNPKYASRPLKADEWKTLGAIRKKNHERVPTFTYWKDGSPIFSFLEQSICRNDSYLDKS